MWGEVLLQPIDLETELERTGLSEEQLGILREHSKQILPIDEFIVGLPSMSDEYRGGLALGVVSYIIKSRGQFLVDGDFYGAMVEMTGLMHCYEEHARLAESGEIGGGCEVGSFLENVAERKLPFVFFVPRYVADSEYPGITQKEMNWFLDEPERLGNATLVFGLYQSVHPEDYFFSVGRKGDDCERERLIEGLQGYNDPESNVCRRDKWADQAYRPSFNMWSFRRAPDM